MFFSQENKQNKKKIELYFLKDYPIPQATRSAHFNWTHQFKDIQMIFTQIKIRRFLLLQMQVVRKR